MIFINDSLNTSFITTHYDPEKCLFDETFFITTNPPHTHLHAHTNTHRCDKPINYFKKKKPLPMEWWKDHDEAIHVAQRSVDSCVRLKVLLAKNKMEGLTDHEKTCKVGGVRSHKS